MWYFQSVADGKRKFLLLPGKEYVVGRRDCDIAIENDQSVSRKHAILSVLQYDVTNVNKPASLVLKDQSKFGTYVNNQKVNKEHILHQGDEVRFGSIKSLHRVLYDPFVATTSCVDGAGKKEVRSLVYQIGGHVSNDWRKDCKFLVMKSITVTFKVVCALVSLTPIVTVNYVRDLVSFLKGHTREKPVPENYLPQVTERLVEPGVSFQMNGKRSTVFLGMSFYFLIDKQFQKINMAVELGGGVPILCDSPHDADLAAFLEDNTVVMNPAHGDLVSQAQKGWVEKVRSYLSKKGKFMVQESEIGYAVLYASTDTYCNPDKDVSHLLPGALPSQSLTQASSLSSQLPASQTQSTHPQPVFRKPPVPAGATQAPSCSREADVLDEPAAKSVKSELSQDIKEQKVFTVPESCTDESVKVKSERDASVVLSRSLADPIHTFHSNKSHSESQPDGKKLAVVKVEDDESCAPDRPRAAAPHQSETVTDAEMLSAPPVKEESDTTHEKPILILDDEDDDIVQVRKPPPSRSKRRFQPPSDDNDDDDDDPFDIPRKCPRKTAPQTSKSPQRIDSPEPGLSQEAVCPAKESKHKTASAGESRKSAALPDQETWQGEHSDEEDVSPCHSGITNGRKRPAHSRLEEHKQARKAASPETLSKRGKVPGKSLPPKAVSRFKYNSKQVESEDSDSEMSVYSVNDRVPSQSSSQKPKPSSKESSSTKADDAERSREADVAAEPGPPHAAHGRSAGSVLTDPVPEGFLTTRTAIADQVPVNPCFEKENIDAPAVVVQFEDLVHRRHRHPAASEDQSDVAQGMMRWKGEIVPNFKKFRKVKHVGADRLPKIIGGRDLEEHRQTSCKMIEDWLKDLTEAESQQQEREREAQKLFDFQPAVRGRKSRR